MVGKKLGLLFLLAVVLSFLTGYFAKEIMPAFFTGKPSETFDFLTDFLDENYYYALDDKKIDQAYIDSLYAIVESYSRQHDDPYTRLYELPKTTTLSFDEYYVGMGIEVSLQDNQIVILEVNTQSDGFGRLLPGDIIIGVVNQGVDIYFDELEDLSDMFSYLSPGNEAEKTVIIQTRDLVEERVTIQIKTILTPSVVVKDLNDSEIAYLKINVFNAFFDDTLNPGTSYLFKEALTQLETSILLQNPQTKTLIIDLRDNPGGALTALHNQGTNQSVIPGIIQDLIPRSLEKPIFSMIPRDESLAVHFNNTRLEKKPYEIKVLVNENSASASEVLAATLYTNGGYTVYGIPTFGKNVYQSSVSLFTYKGIEYGLTYTEGRWYYDGDKNVVDHPIPVERIEQSGYLSLNTPIYQGELGIDSVSVALSNYQKFLNIYFEDVIANPLRTDGYFDLETKELLELYQIEQGLNVTGTLNRETAMSIYIFIQLARQEVVLDVQLQSLIEIIRNA